MTRPSGSRAVLIGVPGYDSPLIDDMDQVSQSISQFAGCLAGSDLWGEESCRVVSDPACLSHVMTPIEEAAGKVSKDGILLVTYSGHGWYKKSGKFEEVHLSLRSTRPDVLWTYIRAWHVYEIMKQSRAALKVLIVDSCQSQQLGILGDTGEPRSQPAADAPAALGSRAILELVADRGDQRAHRSCVLTAVDPPSSARHIQAVSSCASLDGAARGCTAYLGHMINVLDKGTSDPADFLTLRQIVSAVREKSIACNADSDRPHPLSNMLPNLHGADDEVPFIENRALPAERLAVGGAAVPAQRQPRQLAEDLISACVATGSIETKAAPILEAGPQVAASVMRELRELESGGRAEVTNQAVITSLNREAARKLEPRMFLEFIAAVSDLAG